MRYASRDPTCFPVAKSPRLLDDRSPAISNVQLELLLKHGAEENDSDRQRWKLRQVSDACERVALQNVRDIEELAKIPLE